MARAVVSFEAAKAHADRLGDRLLSALVAIDQGVHAFWLGNWSQARAYYQRARRIHLEAGQSAAQYAPSPVVRLGHLSLAEGRQEEANRLFDEAISLISNEEGYTTVEWAVKMQAHVAWARALCHLLDGHPEAARAQLEAFLDQPNPDTIDHLIDNFIKSPARIPRPSGLGRKRRLLSVVDYRYHAE